MENKEFKKMFKYLCTVSGPVMYIGKNSNGRNFVQVYDNIFHQLITVFTDKVFKVGDTASFKVQLNTFSDSVFEKVD